MTYTTYIDKLLKQYYHKSSLFDEYNYIDNKFLYSNPKDYELNYDRGYDYKDKVDYILFKNMKWHNFIFNRNNLPMNDVYYIAHYLGLDLSDGYVFYTDKGYYKFLIAARPLVEYNKKRLDSDEGICIQE